MVGFESFSFVNKKVVVLATQHLVYKTAVVLAVKLYRVGNGKISVRNDRFTVLPIRRQ